jgi:hypothetical protein
VSDPFPSRDEPKSLDTVLVDFFSLNLSKFMHCTGAERSIGLFCLFAEVVLVVVPMMT